MACGSKQKRIRLPVWSDGSASDQFFPFLQMSVADAVDARLSLILEASTGTLTVETAARYGEEETDLPGATLVDFPSDGSPTNLTANGSAYASAYRSLDVSEQLVEFGVIAKNTSGSLREMGIATLIIDLKS